MLLEPTDLASFAALMERTLRSYGLDSRAVLREAGVDLERLESPNDRIPIVRMNRVWELAIKATGDPCIGLVAGGFALPAHFHGVGLAWISSRTLYGALRRLARYHRVLTTGFEIRLVDEDNECLFGVVHPHDLRVAFETVDALFSAVVRFSREIAGEDCSPQRVDLQRSDPGRADAYEEAFHAPVAFGQAQDALVFHRALLEVPLLGGNEALAAQASEIAERYLAEFESTPNVKKVRSVLFDLLPSGRASQTVVARRLHVSVSTLQRNLRAEGTSYRYILDHTRKTLARRYLHERQYALSEIAFLLGFGDQAAFTKAFQRWTGVSPGKYLVEYG